MKNFVPFEKLSKKERKKLNAAKRGSWGEINPISRKSENKKAYNRKNPKVDPWDFQLVEKRATGAFFEDFVVKIIHLWGAFFLEKSAPHPCKKAL